MNQHIDLTLIYLDYQEKPTEVRRSPRLSAMAGPADPPAEEKVSKKPGEMTAEEWKDEHQIKILNNNRLDYEIPDPIQDFAAAPFNVSILKEISKAGFPHPSPIQSQCWPLALDGADLIAIAKTGSGKTCGFLLPAFMHIQRTVSITCKRGDGPVVVCMAPTRELAMQIQEESLKFGRSSRISSVCCYGGMPKGPQKGELQRGVHVVIATPGRLNDFLETDAYGNKPVTNLDRTTFLILDEADRMLDMGFEPQIRGVIDKITSKHQTMMFSATWPKEVQALARDFLQSPIQVNIGDNGTKLQANTSITQIVEECEWNDKPVKFKEIMTTIGADPAASVILFANKKSDCDYLAKECRDIGWAAQSIHGDKDQWERQRALKMFAQGIVHVLVATDVAARGLDIKGVTHVVNYDFPLSGRGCSGVEDWVHRIGRTGRAGKTGIAYTLFDPNEDKHGAQELVQILTDAKQEIPDFLNALSDRWGKRGKGKGGKGGKGKGGKGKGGSKGGKGKGGSKGGKGGSKGSSW